MTLFSPSSDSQPRILIIEDEALFRESVAEFLTIHGFVTDRASDGEEGLKLFRSHPPDMVLLDLRMSGIGGLEVLAEIRRESPDTPCVVVSGAGVLEDAVQALQMGAVEYITKPVQNLVTLVHVVRRGLEWSRLSQENRQYREQLELLVALRTAELQTRTAELEEANRRLLAEIEERRRVEKMIAKAKKEWEITFDSVSDLIAIVGPDFRFLRVNKALADLHGVPPSEMIGLVCFNIFGWLDERSADCPQKDFLQRSIRDCREIVMSRVKTGLWDHISTTPLFSDGEYLGTLLVVRDVTERVRAENALRESEKRFRLLADHATDLVSRITPTGIWQYVSPSATSILGFQPEELIGKSMFELIHPEFSTRIAKCLEQETCRFTFRLRNSQGTYLWMETTSRALTDPANGRTTEIQLSSRDVTEDRRTKEALQDSNEKFSKAFHTSLDAFAIARCLDGRLLEANREFAHVVGASWESLKGMVLDTADFWLSDSDGQRFRDELELKGEVRNFEAVLRSRQGEEVYILLSASALELQQEACLIYSIKDISDQKKAEREISFMALHDHLTGLPNRRLFLDRFEQSLRKAVRLGENIGLLYVDLDHFKQINDIQGHQVGDAVLKEAALRLEQCVRKSDTVARIGGDEFVVLLTGHLEQKHIEGVANKITQELSREFVFSGIRVMVGASVGISQFPTDGQNLEELLTKADRAMYQAKNGGGGGYSFFAPNS